MSLATFAQYGYATTYTTTSADTSGMAWAFFIPIILIYLVVIAIMIVSLWKVFAKTGRPGWAAIVPVYNT